MHGAEIYEEVIKRLTYIEDGSLVWTTDPNETGFGGVSGRIAGKVSSGGYRIVRLRRNGKRLELSAHRIIYYMHHKMLPNILDHIDRDRLNNKIDNLRGVTASQNSRNRTKSKSRKYIGTCQSSSGKYHASVSVNGARIYLGTYKCEMLAAKAYDRYLINNNLSDHANLNFKQGG